MFESQFDNIIDEIGMIETRVNWDIDTAIIALGGLGFGESGRIGADGLGSQETR